jgi:hypothetical protein
MKFLISFPLFITISFAYTIPARYHSYNEMVAELDSLALRYPNITREYTIGLSQTDGLPILALKISDSPALKEDEPSILFTGIHHADELMGCEVCLYLINHLLANYDTNALTKRIIDSTQIWVVPIVNPEGHEVVFAGLDSFWRKNKRDNNNNGIFDLDFDGVDLNRNYNFLFDSGGSADPQSRTYRGPYPLSESETRAMADLGKEENFVLEICYHGDMDSIEGERVYYPWRWGNAYSPDYPFIKPIAEKIAQMTINEAGTGTYRVDLGLVDGGLYRNYLYHEFGTFAYTIEVGTSYTPPESRVDSICASNLPGAYYLMERVFGPSITGRVVDSLTGNPLRARIRLVGIDSSYPIIFPRYSDSVFGRFHRIVNPGNYTLEISKPGYGTKQYPVSVSDIPTSITVYLSPTHWSQLQPLPMPPSNRPISSGAYLVTVGDSIIFALKGNNTRDFYLYYITGDNWVFVDSVPYALERKRKVKQGSALCYDQSQFLYLTKGNNTLEFWRYNLKPNQNEPAWTRLTDVPGQKRLRGGTGIAFVPDATNGYIYLLKGSRTNEFYRFRLPNGPWEPLPNAPGERGFKKGSALAFNQDSLIYCLKGSAKTNEFYAYKVQDSSWRILASLPLRGNSGRSKKVKDGGAMVFVDGKCYAIKGGSSQEFWTFNPPINQSDTGHWIEREPIPLLPSDKKVKAGGAITATDKYVYAFKGAKTTEFWVWSDFSKSSISSGQPEYRAKAYKTRKNNLTWFLNPQSQELQITGNITPDTKLVVYNTLGDKVLRLYLKNPLLDSISLATLPEGIYFVRLISNYQTIETKKIIIIK